MAFVFERPTDGPFWMKDTLVPLSVAFWSSRHTIVALLEMTPCRADPCHLYYPHAMYAGAVEANRGFFLFHGITVGDTVVLRG